MKNITNDLKTKGFRLTKARSMLIQVLEENQTPLSIDDLIKKLESKKTSVNKTTVYREIQFLEKQNVISAVEFGDGKKRYELSGPNHHHHIVCLNCGRIKDIPLSKDLDKHEKNIAKITNYKIINHSLEFFGYCQNCKSKLPVAN